MEHSNLLEVVRGMLSPDTRLEVPASREDYERVNEILGNEEARNPQRWYDSMKNVAIVEAPPTPLPSGITGALLTSIYAKVIMNSGISPEITRNLRSDSGSRSMVYTSRGLTTRASDGAFGSSCVSKSYDSLRAAISCRAATPRMRYYASIEKANAAVGEAEEDFNHQLTQRPYGPLVRYGVTWFGRVRHVVLESYRYRQRDEESMPETLLEPSQSFTLVENGE
ncbi:hypothetical protein V1524DRAFT_473440 [Lipomyces starkeyi]